MNRPHICHLTSVHPATDTRIFHKECKSLASAGYDVSFVVPGASNENLDGVRIVGIAKETDRVARFMRTPLNVLRTALKLEASVYHFHDPDLIPVGLALKLAGKKVIYDVHEDVPNDILVKEYLPRFSRKAISEVARLFEMAGAKVFDGIVAATPTIAEHFPPQKTAVVQNFPILRKESTTSLPYLERPMEINYTGVITRIRAVREMIEAMALLPDSLSAKLTLAGKFSPPELENETSSLVGWERVRFVGWQTQKQVAEAMGRARVGLVLCHPVVTYVESQPTKLFDYMGAGIPVVASDFPLWRKWVRGCGLSVDPQDPKAIAQAMEWLLTHPEQAAEMGERGREAVTKRYNWTKESKKLISLYKSCHRSTRYKLASRTEPSRT